MPRIQQTFTYEQAPDNAAVTMYHYKDYSLAFESVPINNSQIYLEYNKRFFSDLFSLLEQTGLLEDGEIINDSNIGSDKYMQSITIFGCKFQLYLYGGINTFFMFKDFIPMSQYRTLEEYYDSLVSDGSAVIDINNYTITVNYGQTYIDVYVNKGIAEQYCLFTLIKCHSVDNKIDFVYASKNVNGVSYVASNSNYIYNGKIDSGSIYSDNTISSCGLTNANKLFYFYHQIYYSDKNKISNVLHNVFLRYLTQTPTSDISYYRDYIYARASRHMMQCGPDVFNRRNLFKKYDTNEIFNITVDGIKIMKPTACDMNIVFDDLDEVLIGPSDISILCPGRDYTINNIEYYCPGTDDIVYEIKINTENYYSYTCNRWFFKL